MDEIKDGDSVNSSRGPIVKKVKQKIAFKTRFIYFLILSLFAVSVTLYLYIKATLDSKFEYNQGIEYLDTLNKEQLRCTNILTQESGNFEDYDYCRQLLQTFPQTSTEETSN